MQPTKFIRTAMVGNHPDLILVKFGQNPETGFRRKDVGKNVDERQTLNDRTKARQLS